jgi:hypothetical protein
MNRCNITFWHMQSATFASLAAHCNLILRILHPMIQMLVYGNNCDVIFKYQK